MWVFQHFMSCEMNSGLLDLGDITNGLAAAEHLTSNRIDSTSHPHHR